MSGEKAVADYFMASLSRTTSAQQRLAGAQLFISLKFFPRTPHSYKFLLVGVHSPSPARWEALSLSAALSLS